MFLNISQIKGNHTMKFGQLIEYNNRNICFSNVSHKKRQEDYFQTTFCFFKKFYVKSSGLQLGLTLFR